MVAHAMIVIIWHILATGKPYYELGASYFTSRLDPGRETRRLIAKLEALGTPGHPPASCLTITPAGPETVITGQGPLPPAQLGAIHVSGACWN